MAAKKEEELFSVRTGATAWALDVVLGNAEFNGKKETTGSWIRYMIHLGICYNTQNESGEHHQLYGEEMFCLVVARQLRDLGVSYPQIAEILERLEFGGEEEVSITRKKGSVTVTHTVSQKAATKEAQWVLRMANSREHRVEVKPPKRGFSGRQSVTTYSNATLH